MALRFAWMEVACVTPREAALPVTNARTAHAATTARHATFCVIISVCPFVPATHRLASWPDVLASAVICFVGAAVQY
jgi:hypothetical protein